MPQVQSIPCASRIAGARRIGLAAAAALALALPLAVAGETAASEGKASKFVSRCPPRMVAACKSGYHHVCVRRDARGCCLQARCHVN